MPVSLQTVLLLVASNVFMTFAWYGHLKNLADKPWYCGRARSAGASRCSSTCCRCRPTASATPAASAGQLKITQEVITLAVFVPFAMLYMDQPFKLDYLWAGLCLVGAVYFIFRG